MEIEWVKEERGGGYGKIGADRLNQPHLHAPLQPNNQFRLNITADVMMILNHHFLA
jgi:hypothetical protein